MVQIDSNLLYKLFGGVALLLIGLFTWLVVGQFENKSSVNVVQTEVKSTRNITEKMWSLVQENNKILQTKANEVENTKAHEDIMLKMDMLEIQIKEFASGRQYGNNKSGNAHSENSLNTLPYSVNTNAKN
jgi:hypothetical protein